MIAVYYCYIQSGSEYKNLENCYIMSCVLRPATWSSTQNPSKLM